MDKAVIVTGIENSMAHLIMGCLSQMGFPIVSHYEGYENAHTREIINSERYHGITSNKGKALLFYRLNQLIGSQDAIDASKVICLIANPADLFNSVYVQAFFKEFDGIRARENFRRNFFTMATNAQNKLISWIESNYPKQDRLVLNLDSVKKDTTNAVINIAEFVGIENNPAGVSYLEYGLDYLETNEEE